MRPSPIHLIVLLGMICALLIVLQLGLITIVFERLGLSPASASMALFLLLAGSLVNVPLVRIKAQAPDPPPAPRQFGLLRVPVMPFTGTTTIAVNVGGALLPVALSFYLLVLSKLPLWVMIVGVSIMSMVSYMLSRPVPGIGIGLPMLIPPLSAAAVGVLLGGAHSPQLAYVSGTLGVLIGADIARLRDVRQLGVPFASIGGAGTFDGIFLTGIAAALLA